MTLTRAQVQDWLRAYLEAWRTYDRDQIAALYSADSVTYYTPYADPVVGREAIVESWLEDADPPGTWEANYWPELIDGDRAVTRGRTVYFVLGSPDEVRAEFDNVFLLTFNDAGEVTEFRPNCVMFRPLAACATTSCLNSSLYRRCLAISLLLTPSLLDILALHQTGVRSPSNWGKVRS